MDINKLDKIIVELMDNAETIVFPPLNPNEMEKGKSIIIKLTKNSIVFKRKNSKKYIPINQIREAYSKLPLSDKDLNIIFKNQSCNKSFFKQFLKHYNL